MSKSSFSMVFVFLLTLLFFGCVSDTVECNEPYIRVGSDCCLDKNENNICDSDETEPVQKIVEKDCTGASNDYCNAMFDSTMEHAKMALGHI